MIIRLLVLAPALLAAAAVPADEWRSRIKSTLSVPDPLPGLAAQSHGRFDADRDVVVERVSYATQYGMRVPAILYLPKTPSGRIPALIIVNGHGGDKYSWYAQYSGILYARAGAAVLTYDPAGEGERNSERRSGTRAHDKVEDPPELARRLGGLMITDVMQAVSYLAQRPEVDPTRIAAAGYSMGSFVLGLAGAVDTRLRAVVLVGGGNLDGPGGYWDNSKPMCQGIPYRSLSFLGDRPAALYALHADRGPTLIFNGREDTTVAIPGHGEDHLRHVYRRAAALRESEAGMFEFGFTEKAGHRPWFVTKPVARWLDKVLDLPNWTVDQIQAMPETLIGDWARTNSVPIDKLYATQHREGGTRALGTGIPGLTHDQLTAIPLDQWQRTYAKYVHEGWVRNSRESILAAEGKPVVTTKDGPTYISLLPPGPGNPRNTEGAFLPLKDGRLMYVYTKFTGGGGDHDAAILAARHSADGGRTWTASDRQLVGREGTMNAMSVSLIRLADGRIAMFYLRKNSITDCRPIVRYSVDEGESWSEPQDVIPEAGYYVLNNDRVVQLKSGRIVLPLAYHANRPDVYDYRSNVLFYFSDDNGRTWRRNKQTIECPDPESRAGLQEPGIVELKDGRLFMFSRTRLGSQYVAWSSDQGETWTPAQPSDLKSPLSPASIKRIPSTGDLLVVWNDHSQVPEATRTSGLRTPFTAAISKDEGKTWIMRRNIYDDPQGWYCYTAVEFVGDRVLLGLNAGGGSLATLSRTQIVHFPVQWLYDSR